MLLRDLEPPYMVIKPGHTEDEYYRLAGEDDDWEYIDGRIVMHSPASNRHEDIQGFLLTLLRVYLDTRGGGLVRGSRYPMRLDPRWSPEPDLLVVREGRQHLCLKGRLDGPADMVVEIVSEADSSLVYREKLPRYREAGIPEIWIVDPEREEMLVDRLGPGGERESRTSSEGRGESSVVPGFRIDAAWLFRSPLPPTGACLEEILGRTREGA